MATYSQVKKGAKGDAVSELQRLLNQNGYALDVDGVFGSNTQAAVRDYQGKNNLTVDGIVGNQTWSSLFGNNKTSANNLANHDGNRPAYAPSQAANDAASILASYENKRPGAYSSNYATQIQSILDDIMNRGSFSYDFASDPMYKQYSDRYQQQGKLAMMDAMGQAAALTGGYGSSYGQQVGQQTYQGYLQGINDIIPELRDAAYQIYRDEGDQKLTQMGLLQGLENAEYGRYRDAVSDYYNDLNYYYNKYNDISGQEYNRYLNDLAAWQADRNFMYQQQQDELNRAAAKSSSARRSSTDDDLTDYLLEAVEGSSTPTVSEGTTDWTQLLMEASDSDRREILYGTTEEGKAYRDMLVADLGQAALGRYIRKFG